MKFVKFLDCEYIFRHSSFLSSLLRDENHELYWNYTKKKNHKIIIKLICCVGLREQIISTGNM
jgi:hypothetical protein